MIEIEAKFSVPDRAAFDRLCQIDALAGYWLTATSVKQVHDRYLDTADRAFLRAGYALRLREKDGARIATLKELGGADPGSPIHRRAEHEVAVDGADPATWPAGQARDLALRLSGGRPLHELFALHQERHLRLLRAGAASEFPPMAEMSLDVVTANVGGAEHMYLELEIELLEAGAATDLAALADELRTVWGLAPEPRSKFERGLQELDKRIGQVLTANERAELENLVENAPRSEQRRARILLLADAGHTTAAIATEVGLSSRQVRRWRAAFREKRMAIFPGAETHETETEIHEIAFASEASVSEKTWTLPFALPELASPGIRPDDPMSEAGRKTLWFHFVRMLLHEPGTRLGADIEELHDMRVATRRMRAAMRVFGDFFEPEAIAPFTKGIRRVTRALGPVRDLDVFEEKAGHYLQTLSETARGSLDPLLETWHAQRQNARENMLALLDSGRYHKFVREFADFLQTTGAGALPLPRGQPTPYQVRHVAPRLIYTRYETVRAYETVLDNAQIETLHALRIDFKYLRYTLEFLDEVLASEGGSVIKEVKKMQDHLGDLNDAEVAIGLLNDFLQNWDAAQANVPLSQRRSVEGIVTYLAARHAEKHRLLTGFPEVWANFNRDEVRRWLALAVAAL